MPVYVYGMLDRRPGANDALFYVGIGARDRPTQHLREARRGCHPNSRMQKIIAEHFLLRIEPGRLIFAVCPDRNIANEIERALISRHGRAGIDPGGILANLAPGGDDFSSDLPHVIEAKQKAAIHLNALLWADPEHRRSRMMAMRGRKKTMTVEALAQRRANARAPRSEKACAAQLAASLRNWADPAFRQRRSVNQAAAWADPQKRANMLAGRSEGIAESWADPDVRAKREAAVSAAIADKWQNDPDYAERTRAGLRAAWTDPAKKAERVAKMLETRRRKAAERGGAAVTDAGHAAHGAVMQAVNAGKTAEGRSAEQKASWTDPETRERRLAGIRAAAQDPELRAARVAAMLEGKRRKAAERAATAAAGKGECA